MAERFSGLDRIGWVFTNSENHEGFYRSSRRTLASRILFSFNSTRARFACSRGYSSISDLMGMAFTSNRPPDSRISRASTMGPKAGVVSMTAWRLSDDRSEIVPAHRHPFP